MAKLIYDSQILKVHWCLGCSGGRINLFVCRRAMRCGVREAGKANSSDENTIGRKI